MTIETNSDSPKGNKVTKQELLQALGDVVKKDSAISVLSKKDYDDTIEVWVDAFQYDPMTAWCVNFDGVDHHKAKDQFNNQQKQLLNQNNRIFFQWPHACIAKRNKGCTIGVFDDNSQQLVGAVSMVPSSKSIFTFWDLVCNVITVGPMPTQVKKTKDQYGPFAEKRLYEMDKLSKRMKAHMNESNERRRYIYIQTVGVLTAYHGKGIGGKLMRTISQVADTLDSYLYLETESLENKSFYQHFGFYTAETLDLSVEGDTSDHKTLTMYLMIRNPNGLK